ncbi:hypothetical protein CEXT_338371 [Caerostris extrusa]|uniref:Uncharacterized protein n=1 Tax=Caerostris extrusa TaxID=172846 RepID=A0AAV4Y144_CAEEX|nr:hypothetical protein CEXT_338371 [Caerostris extrusa]
MYPRYLATSATTVSHCCHHLSLLFVRIFSAANVTNCCHRSFYCRRLLRHLLPSSSLLPSSTTALCDFSLLPTLPTAVIVFFYCRRLHSCDICYHRLSLLPSSTPFFVLLFCCQRYQLLSSSSSTAVVSYSCDICYHRLSLLPSSTTALCDFLCQLLNCRRLLHFLRHLLPSFLTVAIIYHCFVRLLLPTLPTAVHRRLLFLRHLLPSSLTVAIIYNCFVRLSAANVTNCCHRLLYCRRLLFLRHLLPSSLTVAIIYNCFERLSLLPTLPTAVIVFYCRRLLLPSSSILATSATITVAIIYPCFCATAANVTNCCHFYSRRLLFLRHLLSPFTVAIIYHCFVRQLSTAAMLVFFYCRRLLFLRHLLPPSLSLLSHCCQRYQSHTAVALCYHRLHLPLLCAYCQRYQLLSSSSFAVVFILATSATIVSSSTILANVTNCCHRLFTAVVFSCDICYHRFSLLPSSTTDFLCCQRYQLLSSSSSTAVVFYSCDICYHRLSLLPSSTTAFVRSSPAANVTNCCHRLLLLPSSSILATSATIVSHCCHHLPLLCATFSANVTNCCHPWYGRWHDQCNSRKGVRSTWQMAVPSECSFLGAKKGNDWLVFQPEDYEERSSTSHLEKVFKCKAEPSLCRRSFKQHNQTPPFPELLDFWTPLHLLNLKWHPLQIDLPLPSRYGHLNFLHMYWKPDSPHPYEIPMVDTLFDTYAFEPEELQRWRENLPE